MDTLSSNTKYQKVSLARLHSCRARDAAQGACLWGLECDRKPSLPAPYQPSGTVRDEGVGWSCTHPGCWGAD